MHELSIADSIIKTVLHEIEVKQLPAVKRIVVRIGALSGVVPDALEFGFEALVIDTPLERSRLVIEFLPVRGKCRECGKDFEVENFLFACPHCASGAVDVTQGEELDIAYLDVEDESPPERHAPS